MLPTAARLRLARVCALGLVGAAACKPDNQVVRQTAEDSFRQAPTDQVDILWVVDNSLSMEDEQAQVADKFDAFVTSLEDSELEFHLAVMTTDLDDVETRGKLVGDPAVITWEQPDYVAEFQARVQVGTDGSDREEGIDAAFQALSEPLVSGANAGFLRDGATLSIIYLSDENDCSDRGALNAYTEATACYDHSDELVSVRELISDYKGLKYQGERILVSSIVGPQIVDNCDGAVPGFRYETMAEAFGGVRGSICDADFSGIMSELGVQASGILTSFNLTYAAVPESIEVYVDDVAVAEDAVNGWTYDPTYWVLTFHGTGVPPRDSEIHVLYEVASGGSRPTDTGA